MKKISLILAITLCSWLGWWLGESFGIMTAYWLSFTGSLAWSLSCWILPHSRSVNRLYGKMNYNGIPGWLIVLHILELNDVQRSILKGA